MLNDWENHFNSFRPQKIKNESSLSSLENKNNNKIRFYDVCKGSPDQTGRIMIPFLTKKEKKITRLLYQR